MSQLDTSDVKLIIAELRSSVKKPFLQLENFHHLIDDNEVTKIAKQIFQYDKRPRDFEQIYNQVYTGKLHEHAATVFLSQLGCELQKVNPGDNFTKFCFDVICRGKKIEIKAINALNKFLSFSTNGEYGYLKVRNFRENWRYFDIMLAIKSNYVYGATSAWFKPWMIIDHTAFDPNNKQIGDPNESLFHNKNGEIDGKQKNRWVLHTNDSIAKGLALKFE